MKISTNTLSLIIGGVIIFLLVFLPNIILSVDQASNPPFAPSDNWINTMLWLREETPKPFGDPDFYYDFYAPTLEGDFDYPDTAYGVMSWWDYGHWITRIGRRIPNANPANWGICPTFYACQDVAIANGIMDDWGIKYVIVDYDLISVSGKFHAIPTLFQKDPKDYYDVYYQPKEGGSAPVVLFYPEYYRTIPVRLYNFNGEAVYPENSLVVTYKVVEHQGDTYNIITDAKYFDNYEIALLYAMEGENRRLAGVNPFVSPIPLEEMGNYELVYSSALQVEVEGVGLIPEIKIFEYVK